MAEDRPRPEFTPWDQFRASAALARSTKFLRRVRASIEELESDAAVPRDQSRALRSLVDEIEWHVRAATASSD
jgi:hypothetical protein